VSVVYREALSTLIQGDCIEVMAEMEECSVDAIVTNPPSRAPRDGLKGVRYENHRGLP